VRRLRSRTARYLGWAEEYYRADLCTAETRISGGRDGAWDGRWRAGVQSCRVMRVCVCGEQGRMDGIERERNEKGDQGRTTDDGLKDDGG
jgi:hypothetical protein